MSAFVLDTSITMAWCFEDEANPAADAVLDQLRSDTAVVPPIWSLEVANVALGAQQRGRLTEAQAARFLELLSALPIFPDDAATRPDELVAAGRRHKLSAYDASYLILAERMGAPLATLDDGLAAAARRAGVPVLGAPKRARRT